jgi:hypothetical protein
MSLMSSCCLGFSTRFTGTNSNTGLGIYLPKMNLPGKSKNFATFQGGQPAADNWLKAYEFKVRLQRLFHLIR